jgi:rubrerythrin
MTEYKCPVCGNTIKVGVNLRVPPICANPKHRKVEVMIVKEKK